MRSSRSRPCPPRRIPRKPSCSNATTSALLHRETAVTAFQYPFALNLNDCKPKADWTRKLLKAIGELNDVAGNHARSYFEMAPASIIIRLTESLVAGFNTYCFKPRTARLPDVIDDILKGDYPRRRSSTWAAKSSNAAC